MSIFEKDSYRTYLAARVAEQPRGEITRMAQAAGASPTLMSMVLSGEREISMEQAFDLSRYLQHTELEEEFFLLQVQLARAGNARLKQHVRAKLEKLRGDSKRTVNRIEHTRKLNDEERTIFYSSWLYSAIRLYCSVGDDGRTVEEIAERFQIARPRAVEMVTFMTSIGLTSAEGDRYKMGIARTFLEQGSPHLPRHHMNWRAKAMQKSDHVSDRELMFTFPMSISEDDFAHVREILVETLEKVSAILKESEPADVACLNIDWFKV